MEDITYRNCPHCGREISIKFTSCPFCKKNIYNNTEKITAAEFIKKRKIIEQNEILKLRKDILAFYNIEGDVSDEEYAQLKTFYQTDKPHANNISHTSNHGETLLYTLNVILLIIGIFGAIILIVLGEFKFLYGFAIIGTLLFSFGFTSVFLTISKNIRAIADSSEKKI